MAKIMPWDEFKALCDKRDVLVDKLMAEFAWALPRFLLDGSHAEDIPIPLVKAQQAVMEALNVMADAPTP